MTGWWLARILQSFVHGDTFELTVAPAIADLQFEAPTAAWPARVDGYVAVGRAVVGGLLHDLCLDTRSVAADAPLLARVACIQAGYHCAILSVIMDLLSFRSTLLLVVGIFGMSLCGTVLCFWPARQPPACQTGRPLTHSELGDA